MRRENEPDEQLTKDSMAAVIQATMPFNVNKHEFTVHTNTHMCVTNTVARRRRSTIKLIGPNKDTMELVLGTESDGLSGVIQL